MLSTSVKSVLEIQKKRSQRENELKNKLVGIIKERINNYAKHGQMKCVYRIPAFVFGYSPYNINEMTEFIYKKLDSEGYYLILHHDYNLFISWDVNDIKRSQKKKEKHRRKMDDLIPLMSLKK
jgi:hypothetical protein